MIWSGEHLERLLGERHLSVEEFARRVPCAPASIWAYIKGRSVPRLARQYAMADVLSITVDELAGVSDSGDSPIGLSEREGQVVEVLRRLSDIQVGMVAAFAAGLAAGKTLEQAQAASEVAGVGRILAERAQEAVGG